MLYNRGGEKKGEVKSCSSLWNLWEFAMRGAVGVIVQGAIDWLVEWSAGMHGVNSFK